ncbi:MAG: phage tail protein [Cypionkella sp.]
MKELLPIESTTEWEAATADSLAPIPNVDSSIGLIRGTKLLAPPPSFLPYLIYEYGLGELTPYVPNLYDLIAEGIDWQRVRGTPSAMALALGWLGYTAVIEEEATTRRFWNLFQLRLDRVRDTELDLERIAGVAGLSVPIRSKFWRGFSGLDIRPLTYSESSYSNAHYGEYSGVRLHANGPLWSFGRKYEYDVVANEADLTALGAWLPPIEGEDDLDWGDFTWEETESSWESSAARARSEAMASGVIGRSAWFVFFNAANQPIGYRRARASHFVVPVTDGPYAVGGGDFAPQATVATQIYLEAQTGFGDGSGTLAASFGLVFDASPLDPARPGQQWLTPDEIIGGTAPVAVHPIDIAFGETVRERVKVLLRF